MSATNHTKLCRIVEFLEVKNSIRSFADRKLFGQHHLFRNLIGNSLSSVNELKVYFWQQSATININKTFPRNILASLVFESSISFKFGCTDGTLKTGQKVEGNKN